MKHINIQFLLFAGGLSALTACSDLEIGESMYHSEEYQFSDFSRTKESINYVYSFLQDGLSPVGGTMRDCASDDAVYAWAEDPVKTFYDGSWAANNTIDCQWSHYYEGIRSANRFIQNCPDDFPFAEYIIDYESLKQELLMYPYEAKALRAYYHFELLKRYGNIVISDRTFSQDEVNSLRPSDYQDVTDWIAGECDACAEKLPSTWKGSYSNQLGRVTRGFVMALKARLLLYAASPLHNPSGDVSLWLRAAEAAKDVIDLPDYSLADENDVNNQDAAGLIFGLNKDASNSFERANFPVGYEGGNSGVCPSLNLMEAFDMKDGTPFSWEEHGADALDLTKRDPRMARTMIVNGSVFKDETVETWYGGRNGLPQEGASPTSFYLRKFLQEDTKLLVGDETSYSHLYPLFRLTEMYLDYAEALFCATGNPDFTGTLDGVLYTMSPSDALDAVRARVGMPPVETGSPEEFLERLKKERRVELAFEDHRFWDVRRWKDLDETTKIYRVEVSRQQNTFFYEKSLYETRSVNDCMYFYPISNAEIYKNGNLIQNPNW